MVFGKIFMKNLKFSKNKVDIRDLRVKIHIIDAHIIDSEKKLFLTTVTLDTITRLKIVFDQNHLGDVFNTMKATF